MKVIVRLPATLSGVTARRKIARQLRGHLETPRADRASVPPQNTKCFGDPAWPAIEARPQRPTVQASLVGWREQVRVVAPLRATGAATDQRETGIMELDFAKTDGLIPAIVQDAAQGDVLMVGFMNQEAFDHTIR